MKTPTRILAAGATFLLALGAVAADPTGTRNDGRRPVKLTEATELLGTSVPAGTYELRWTREPGTESVKLEVARGKRVYASGKGTWAHATEPYPHEALVYSNTSGARELAQIRFRGSAEIIAVESRTSAVATGTSE